MNSVRVDDDDIVPSGAREHPVDAPPEILSERKSVRAEQISGLEIPQPNLFNGLPEEQEELLHGADENEETTEKTGFTSEEDRELQPTYEEKQTPDSPSAMEDTSASFLSPAFAGSRASEISDRIKDIEKRLEEEEEQRLVAEAKKETPRASGLAALLGAIGGGFAAKRALSNKRGMLEAVANEVAQKAGFIDIVSAGQIADAQKYFSLSERYYDRMVESSIAAENAMIAHPDFLKYKQELEARQAYFTSLTDANGNRLYPTPKSALSAVFDEVHNSLSTDPRVANLKAALTTITSDPNVAKHVAAMESNATMFMEAARRGQESLDSGLQNMRNSAKTPDDLLRFEAFTEKELKKFNDFMEQMSLKPLPSHDVGLLQTPGKDPARLKFMEEMRENMAKQLQEMQEKMAETMKAFGQAIANMFVRKP